MTTSRCRTTGPSGQHVAARSWRRSPQADVRHQLGHPRRPAERRGSRHRGPCDGGDERSRHDRRGRQLHPTTGRAPRADLRRHRTAAFSTVFGTPSRDGYSDGPFDPLYPHDTMLSDGKVDAGDAPMPAAQIDVDDRREQRRPDRHQRRRLPRTRATRATTTAVTAWARTRRHNYDQPFYHQYIPATDRPIDAAGSAPYGGGGGAQPTGIDGSGDPDGFNGFWFNAASYQNWEFAYESELPPERRLERAWSTARSRATCLHYRPLPYGDERSHGLHRRARRGRRQLRARPRATTSTISAPSRTSTAAAISRTSTRSARADVIGARRAIRTSPSPPGSVRRPWRRSWCTPCSTRPSLPTRRAPEQRTRTSASSSLTRRTSTDPRSLTRSSAGASRAPATSTSIRPALRAERSSTRTVPRSRSSTPFRPSRGTSSTPTAAGSAPRLTRTATRQSRSATPRAVRST